MTSKREQFYKRPIAELEAQLKQRDQRIATLEKQVTELLKANAGLTKQVTRLTDKIAKLSKNSSNSSKPPSSDIVKPPKPKQSDEPSRQGGQPGHKGVNRRPFWATGYCVSTVGLDEEMIRQYIREQELLESGQGELDLK